MGLDGPRTGPRRLHLQMCSSTLLCSKTIRRGQLAVPPKCTVSRDSRRSLKLFITAWLYPVACRHDQGVGVYPHAPTSAADYGMHSQSCGCYQASC